MLKTRIIERYRPPNKTLESLNSIPNIKLEITNGYAQIIEKTNIKQVFPIVYKINDSLTIYHFINEEVNKKPYYVLEHNEAYNLDDMKKLILSNNL